MDFSVAFATNASGTWRFLETNHDVLPHHLCAMELLTVRMDLTKLTAFVPMIDSNAIFANEVLIVSSHTIACQQRMSVIEKMIAQDIMKKGKQYQPEVGVENPTFETKAKDSKKFKAKDRHFEDRPSRGQGQKCSRPKARNRGHNFLNYGRQIFTFKREGICDNCILLSFKW